MPSFALVFECLLEDLDDGSVGVGVVCWPIPRSRLADDRVRAVAVIFGDETVGVDSSVAFDTRSWDDLVVPVDTRFDGRGGEVVVKSTSFRFLDLEGVVKCLLSQSLVRPDSTSELSGSKLPSVTQP